MTPIRLIAADMDGTLLDSRSRLPAGIFPMNPGASPAGVSGSSSRAGANIITWNRCSARLRTV